MCSSRTRQRVDDRRLRSVLAARYDKLTVTYRAAVILAACIT